LSVKCNHTHASAVSEVPNIVRHWYLRNCWRWSTCIEVTSGLVD